MSDNIRTRYAIAYSNAGDPTSSHLDRDGEVVQGLDEAAIFADATEALRFAIDYATRFNHHGRPTAQRFQYVLVEVEERLEPYRESRGRV